MARASLPELSIATYTIMAAANVAAPETMQRRNVAAQPEHSSDLNEMRTRFKELKAEAL